MAELDRISDELAAATLAPLDADQRERLLRRPGRGPPPAGDLDGRRSRPRTPPRPTRAGAWATTSPSWPSASRRRSTPRARCPPPPRTCSCSRASTASPPAAACSRRSTPDTGEIAARCGSTGRTAAWASRGALGALEQHASARGHTAVRLYTNRSLDEAKAMYRSRGYVEIPRYNDDPYANHWFEKRLSASAPSAPDGTSAPATAAPRGRSAHAALGVEPDEVEREAHAERVHASGSAGSRAPRRTAASGAPIEPAQPRAAERRGRPTIVDHPVTRLSRSRRFSPRPRRTLGSACRSPNASSPTSPPP